MDRLVYIINICPVLAVPALQLAAQHAFRTRDADLYRNAANIYDGVAANAQLPPAVEVAPLDQAWYDEWSSKNLAERTRLEVELKTYTSNMIKESIRVRYRRPIGRLSSTDDASTQMAHRDLGQFYLSVGDYTGALKHFTKIRESCTTSQHVVDMCIAILEVETSPARISVHPVLTKSDLASHTTRQLFSHIDVRLQSRHRARCCIKCCVSNFNSRHSRSCASQEKPGKGQMADET